MRELDVLPDSAFCVSGVHPLYRSAVLASQASPLNSSHIHSIGPYVAHMPYSALPGSSMAHHMSCPADIVDVTALFELPLTPFCIDGQHPLFTTEAAARNASQINDALPTVLGDYTFFMPSDSLASGVEARNMATSGQSCPEDVLDVTMRLRALWERPREHPYLSPSAIAAIVMCSVLVFGIFVAALSHRSQKTKRNRARVARTKMKQTATGKPPAYL
eukprot:scaffold9148_cov34-Tisochrysis_lutea.AAC.1